MRCDRWAGQYQEYYYIEPAQRSADQYLQGITCCIDERDLYNTTTAQQQLNFLFSYVQQYYYLINKQDGQTCRWLINNYRHLRNDAAAVYTI